MHRTRQTTEHCLVPMAVTCHFVCIPRAATTAQSTDCSEAACPEPGLRGALVPHDEVASPVQAPAEQGAASQTPSNTTSSAGEPSPCLPHHRLLPHNSACSTSSRIF